MTEKILVAVAWPYANGSLHLGQIAGAYLPADIFARYHRLKGNDVLMVSGSDQHGTPITIKAEQEGKKPGEIAGRYHREFLESWQRLGISFDLFTTTGTENHTEVVQDLFLTLLEKGYIYKAKVSQPYCPQCNRFLPDRYIEGTCPFCGSAGARGDQCDDCGKPMNPAELLEPRCRLCAAAPVFEESEHFFLKLSAFQKKLLEWVKPKSHWRKNVLNFTTRYLEDGLKDRAITRDIDWGVPVPLEGYENKRIYVWFEAVIGYLSASKEWAKSGGDGEGWRPFWQGDDSKSYYFIGKDNIPFHTIIWPAMLMGYGGLNRPYDVPANEFLTIEGKKLSTSRNWAVWLPDYLSRYEPDPLRYLLSINMPESGDTDFSWREFFRRNNDELVATYGNLVHRVLTFVYRNFDGCVPTYADMGATINVPPLDSRDSELIDKAIAVYNHIYADGGLLSACHFKRAIMMAMTIAQETNRYLDEKSPWKIIKENRGAAATSLYVAICAISYLKTMLYPFLPFSSQKVHEFLGFKGSIEDYVRKYPLQPLPTPGQKLGEPEPLFTKLDDKLIDEETARLGV
ncbi:MAG: methionine--tRNA ligase [Dehalococcoidia bacterium]|nr:methionine--tRNA ligase [Dehalococcoidia bacterium]